MSIISTVFKLQMDHWSVSSKNKNYQIDFFFFLHESPQTSCNMFTDVLKGLQHASLTFGLYSAFLALRAIVFKSSLQPRFTVDTMFLIAEK